ncbi:RNA-guided endonuclease TnpB family protein [Alicyclobacillus sp. SO9]|uniref:RNA-guided endonuclease TnpB family protein n=1 Tax=Alicyclobacillus sp. SO9 TaxID=2665646 RepID=UPI0018E73A93|nr:RNA-guided endonuclease TnpB family protein [Alicyclobacillus sp. SO9]QQE80048.1 transposase [Alicyclobacillus sp. SO9]
MTQHIRVMQYQIVKPCNGDWSTLAKVLSYLQNATRQVLNKTIQLCWEWQGFGSDYKRKFGENAVDRELLGYSLFGFCYHQLRQEFPLIHSSNISQSIQRAVLRWNSDAPEILNGVKSVPCYKRGVGVDLHKDTVRLKRGKNNEFVVSMNLLSLIGRKEFGFKSAALDTVIKVADGRQRQIFSRVLSGEYGLGACQIVCHKRKWFLQMRYKLAVKERQLNSNHILAVRMGIERPLYIAFSHTSSRVTLNGDNVTAFRKKFMARYAGMIRQKTMQGGGNIGRGKAKRFERIESMRTKISGFQKSLNHKYSRIIVEQAVLNRCGTIQIESPNVIRRQTAFLGNWAYFDLKRKVEYKAQQLGIKVVCLKTRDYEQRCSQCGHLNAVRETSKVLSGAYARSFFCESCGLLTTVDENAVQNLTLPNKPVMSQD